jgi:hypothetical protein
MQIQEVITAPRSPWQNAYVERFIGSCAASTTFAGQRQLFLPAKGQQRECP